MVGTSVEFLFALDMQYLADKSGTTILGAPKRNYLVAIRIIFVSTLLNERYRDLVFLIDQQLDTTTH
jgi:hypothetical protein